MRASSAWDSGGRPEMERYLWIAIGAMLMGSHASGQTISPAASVVDAAGPADPSGTLAAADSTPTISPEFQPMTASERARRSLIGTFGPGAMVRAAAAGGIAQWSGTPKEWGNGAAAYG